MGSQKGAPELKLSSHLENAVCIPMGKDRYRAPPASPTAGCGVIYLNVSAPDGLCRRDPALWQIESMLRCATWQLRDRIVIFPC
jgi:hypothetical protein